VTGSIVYGGSPPKGCELCARGEKAIVFVTGLCSDRCFYCPVSKKKMHRDVLYVNELRASNTRELVMEIERSGARGAGLTGGEPLMRLDRTLSIIRELKQVFGEEFHVHLYTSGAHATLSTLKTLERTGLDEIRFHPVTQSSLKGLESAVRHTGISAGIEVPAIPGEEERLLRLAEYLDSIGGEFMNVNEMEASESNALALVARGFKVEPNGVTVQGSRETALRLLRMVEERGLNVKVHFCPASFKTLVQTRLRYKNTVERDLQVYERVVQDFMVEWFDVALRKAGSERCNKLANVLLEEGLLFECSDETEAKVCRTYSIEWISELTLEDCISRVERKRAYPTHSRMVIESEIILEP